MTYYHDCIWAFIRTTVHLQGGGLKKPKKKQKPAEPQICSGKCQIKHKIHFMCFCLFFFSQRFSCRTGTDLSNADSVVTSDSLCAVFTQNKISQKLYFAESDMMTNVSSKFSFFFLMQVNDFPPSSRLTAASADPLSAVTAHLRAALTVT